MFLCSAIIPTSSPASFSSCKTVELATKKQESMWLMGSRTHCLTYPEVNRNLRSEIWFFIDTWIFKQNKYLFITVYNATLSSLGMFSFFWCLSPKDSSSSSSSLWLFRIWPPYSDLFIHQVEVYANTTKCHLMLRSGCLFWSLFVHRLPQSGLASPHPAADIKALLFSNDKADGVPAMYIGIQVWYLYLAFFFMLLLSL